MNVGFRLHYGEEKCYISQSELSREKEGSVTIYRGEVRGCQIVWRFEPLEMGICIDLTVEADKPLEISRIDSIVFSIGIPEKTDRIAFFGNDRHHSEPRFPDELGIDREYCADCVGHFHDFVSPGMVIAGVVPFQHVFGAGVVAKRDKTVEFFAKTEFTKESSHACRLVAQRVFWASRISVDELYDIYRELLPKSNFPMPKLMGWNSWDYYLSKVTPEDIYENVDALKKLPFARQLKYIVIDDGWQKKWGDWVENEKFSCGLDVVARRIIEAGFVPGIWMSPLAVREDSELFQCHPEWLCRKEDGTLFYKSQYYIDPTIPEAKEFILSHYRKLYRAGYRLFKIDYLYQLTEVRVFFDKSATAYSALKDLIRQIIECTGEDVVILGCSLPIQCGANVAPSMRIAVDIHNHFAHAKWIAEALSWTWMYNNTVTRIDPDFMIVRGGETSREVIDESDRFKEKRPAPVPKAEQTDEMLHMSRWCYGKRFNALEAETWANLVAVCGGNIFLSDRITMLNERGIDILTKAIAIATNQGRPHFLESDQRLPSVWTGEGILLIINWEDSSCEKELHEIEGCWKSDKPFVMDNGRLKVKLAPHESFVAVRCD